MAAETQEQSAGDVIAGLQAHYAAIEATIRERNERLAAACEANQLPPRCEGEDCNGLTEWEGFAEVACPLRDSAGCPWLEVRSARADRSVLAQLGFGERYQQPTIERVPPGARAYVEEYVANIREAVKGKGRYGMYLTGGVGSGKTTAAALIARAARRADLYVLYRYAPTLFDDLHHGSDAAEALARRADLLIIDDLGAQYNAEWGCKRFASIIEARYSANRVMLVTSNHSIATWGQHDNPDWQRIADRLREMCVEVGTGAVSQRQRPATPGR